MVKQNETSSDSTSGLINRHQKDAGITIAILAVAIFFVFQSLPFLDNKASAMDPGAAVWPLLSLGVIIIGGVFNLGAIYLRTRSEDDSESDGVRSTAVGEFEADLTIDNRKVYLMAIGLLLIYVSLLDTIGFVVLTPFFLILMAWNSGYRETAKLLVFGPAVSIILLLVFRSVFNIAIPRGVGVFREISLFFEGFV